MKTFSFKTRQNNARLILIIGLLAGLFFSGGEGIQLFPFSLSDGNNSKNSFAIIKDSQKQYALSVHTSGNHLSLLKSKFQKHTNQYLSVRDLIFDWSNARSDFCLQSPQIREEAGFSPVTFVSRSQSDRAPPAV
jgi:hypothetical protein